MIVSYLFNVNNYFVSIFSLIKLVLKAKFKSNNIKNCSKTFLNKFQISYFILSS